LSAGSNGELVYFDLENGKRGKGVKVCSFPFSCMAISSKGEVCAIAQGYDWCCGFRSREERVAIEIWIKKIIPQEFGI
jgi:hypothetical protein